MLRPTSGGGKPGEALRERLEPVANRVPVAICSPIRNFRSERHPIFVAVISIADLGGDDDPEQPVPRNEMSRRHEFVAECLPDGLDLCAFESVFDRVDRKAMRETRARQGVEMPFQPGLRFK